MMMNNVRFCFPCLADIADKVVGWWLEKENVNNSFVDDIRLEYWTFIGTSINFPVRVPRMDVFMFGSECQPNTRMLSTIQGMKTWAISIQSALSRNLIKKFSWNISFLKHFHAPLSLIMPREKNSNNTPQNHDLWKIDACSVGILRPRSTPNQSPTHEPPSL